MEAADKEFDKKAPSSASVVVSKKQESGKVAEKSKTLEQDDLKTEAPIKTESKLTQDLSQK